MERRKRIKTDIVTVISILILGIVILMAIAPQLFTHYDPLEVVMKDKLLEISKEHWCGTDEFGRDIFARLVYGARNSILVGLGTAILSALVGVPLGLIAGFFGGIVDNIVMRLMDAFQSFPSMILAILLSTVVTPSVGSLILVISFVSFPRFARLTRGQVLTMKKQDYVAAAKIAGVNPGYLLFKSVLPNCMSVIIVQFSMLTATAILIEASMSFIGLGIAAPAPAWGSMLYYANQYINSSITYIIAPTLMIFLVVLSINMLGDTLRDWLDPKRKR